MIAVRDFTHATADEYLAHVAAVRARLFPKAAPVVARPQPKLSVVPARPKPLPPVKVPTLAPGERDILHVATPRLTRRFIVETVCKVFGVSMVDIKSERRTVDVARARQAAMWLIREHTKASLPEIGRILGDRDHTTILHGVKRCAEVMARDAKYRDRVVDAEAIVLAAKEATA